jgi:amino acid adenylation domain-containing protein
MMIDFSADLFDPPTIRRMRGWLETLLGGAIAAPGRRLSELPLIPEPERHQLTREWNDTAQTRLNPAASLHGLFEAVAADRPGAVALVTPEREWTYGELNAEANRWAHHLRLLGVANEVPVAVCLERSAELVMAFLAVLKAGGAYVPLPPDAPQRRLLLLLEETGAPVLISEERLLDWAPPFAVQAVYLDTGGFWVAASPETNPEPAAEAGDADDALAYVLYTSGSTGVPKGVAVPHRAVIRLVRETGYARFGPDQTFLQLAPAAFDASTLEIWGPLLNGGRLIIPPAGPASLEQIGGWLEGHGVTTLWLTAGLFHQMVEDQLPRLAGLGQLLAGGDALSPAHVERALAAFAETGSGTRLINGYGPTENTTFTACHVMTRPEDAGEPGASVPIGRPIAGTRIHLLGRDLEPVPLGVTGELCAGGSGLARGYLGRPDLTAERFVPDPSSEVGGERLYRTGDLARLRPDGRLEFLGRLDRQVKIRGFRIEPGEVEAALTDLRGVRQAAVLVREDRPGDRRLVAFLTPQDPEADGEALASEVRAALADRLPEYMVPSSFRVLPELPLTPNGKVDRAALAGLDLEEGTASSRQHVAPRTPAEELLAGLWSELLGKERVGVHDDFFDLGGHSLLATQLVSRVRSLFGVDLDLGAVFEDPTLGGLAARIETGGPGAEPAPPIVPAGESAREAGLPLSFAQQRLWFLDRLAPGSAAYNVPAAVRLVGDLDRAALEASFNAIAARHEVLRTTFHPGGEDGAGEPVQRVAPAAFRPLPLVDLAALPEPLREARRLAAAEGARPFDLETGPVVRWTLLGLGPQEHAVLFTLHHIASDGWSVGILTSELAALYPALSLSRLPPLPVQYADFAVWQRGWLRGAPLERQLAFWRERLAGAPPLLELPADRPRPAMPSGRGALVPAFVPEALAGRLAALARREGATLFMTLLAGWTALLARVAGQPDVLVGTPVANRNRQETEKLIGFFVNTLVLRADLRDDPPFAGLVRRLRGETLAAFAHQDLPFERLVEELAPERSLAHTPLFQVMFALQNAAATAGGAGGAGSVFELPGVRLEPFAEAGGEARERAAKFDLTFELMEAGTALVGSLEISRDLFDPATAERWLRHFTTLLEAAVEEPERPVSDLPLLTPAEREQAVAAGDGGPASADPDATLHELFEAQADRTPGALALVDGGASGEGLAWTYAELEERANRLARILRRLGVGPESAVGVCAGRTPDTVAAFLAVLKAGGAYVPLDPAYPAERLTFLSQDARLAALLTDRPDALPFQVNGEGPPVLALGEAETSGGLEGRRLAPLAGPDNLAYVIYTSGSTGRPKGVAIRHGSAAALLRWAAAAFAPGEMAGVLASTSFSFDLSVFELFAPLSRGGAAILAENALALPGIRLPAGLAVTLVNTVPSAMNELLRADALPATVRTVNLAGEALPESVAARLLEREGGPALWNLYGPSEDTTYSTFERVRPGTAGSPPIGVPLPGTRAHVFDARLEPVPPGVAGELYLGGAGLARGYLHRPDLTAEKFIPDPFAGGEAGGRLYRTGDRVRRRPDGRLDFLGRLDSQVKVRGFRIELGEIETVLERHPAVRQAAVLAREDRLVAYVASEGEASELRGFLAERLPAHFVPSAFIALAALPLTPNGKVDRAALRRLEPGVSGGSGAGYAPPSTPTEEVLAGIWAEVLGTDRPIGIHDNFFELSGHSLLAVQVGHRIRQRLGVDLPLRRLFERATLADLAREVDAAGREAAEEGVPPLVRVPREEWLPTSFLQQMMWQVQGGPIHPLYNMPFAMRLRGPLDLAVLRASLGELARRHEGLRTRFEMIDGQFLQQVLPPEPVALPEIDLGGLPADRREDAARRLAWDDAALPFDLRRAPLFQALLARLDADDAVLLFKIHHIVSDGWSLNVLQRDLSVFYTALAAGEDPRQALPDLLFQPADYASWQRFVFAGDLLERRLEYWRQRFADRPEPFEIPTDRPRSGRLSAPSLQRGFLLQGEELRRLREVAREAGCTPSMVTCAVLNAILARRSGRADVVLNMTLAGRDRPELTGMVGFFMTLLPVRTDVSGELSLAELLARVRAALLEAYARQDLPFPKLIAAVVPDRPPSRTALSRVAFNHLSLPAGSAAPPLAGLTLEPFTAAETDAKYDLTYFGQEGEGFLLNLLEVSAELFELKSLEAMDAEFQALLRAALADPAAPLSGLT